MLLQRNHVHSSVCPLGFEFVMSYDLCLFSFGEGSFLIDKVRMLLIFTTADWSVGNLVIVFFRVKTTVPSFHANPLSTHAHLPSIPSHDPPGSVSILTAALTLWGSVSTLQLQAKIRSKFIFFLLNSSVKRQPKRVREFVTPVLHVSLRPVKFVRLPVSCILNAPTSSDDTSQIVRLSPQVRAVLFLFFSCKRLK